MQGITAKPASNSSQVSLDSIRLKTLNLRLVSVAEDIVFLLSPLALKFYLILMINQKHHFLPLSKSIENSQIKNEFTPDQITMCLDELQGMDLVVQGAE